MYNDTKRLKKWAHKIKEQYGNLDLCNDYRTLLFRTHVNAAASHLLVASEYLEDDQYCDEDEECEANNGTNFWLAMLVIVMAIIILFVAIG